MRKSLRANSYRRNFCLPRSFMYPYLICSVQAEGSIRYGRGSSASRVSTYRASHAGRGCVACTRSQCRNASKPSSAARSAACWRHVSVITPLYSFAMYAYYDYYYYHKLFVPAHSFPVVAFPLDGAQPPSRDREGYDMKPQPTFVPMRNQKCNLKHSVCLFLSGEASKN